MLMTNIILLLAVIAMIGIAVWLFHDGDKRPEDSTAVRVRDADKDEERPRG